MKARQDTDCIRPEYAPTSYRRDGKVPRHRPNVGSAERCRLRAEQADGGCFLYGVITGGDAQLAVNRSDLGLDGMAGDEQPLGDLVGGEVGLQVGKQP